MFHVEHWGDYDMILKLLIDMIFTLVHMVISMIPVLHLASVADGAWNAMYLLNQALKFFPIDLWTATITNIVGWTAIFIPWTIFEWIYKKIPGVS